MAWFVAGSYGQFRAGKPVKPTASTGLLERAMGIEQIQSAKTKALLPAFSVQLESGAVCPRLKVFPVCRSSPLGLTEFKSAGRATL